MKIIDKALEEEVKIIFVQPEFPKKSAESVAQAIKGSVVVLNPLNPDYINNLLYLAEEVRKALIK
jgi:zinc transport system substrate-binding protein